MPTLHALPLLLSLLASPPLQQDREPSLVTEDGAWCWFADPRAVRLGGAEDRAVVGWISREGDVVAGAFDHASGGVETVVLHERLQADDHDNPAFLVRPDGRLLAFYSRHGGRDMFLRVGDEPGGIGSWSPERALPLHVGRGELPQGTSVTYPNPVLLSEESDRIWLFWRGLAWKPTCSWSDDGGATWEPGRILFAAPGAGAANRPYTKVASDGKGRIHFAVTDGHPRNEATNSIYYFRYEGGAFFRADGTRLAGVDELPVSPSDVDVVYDGKAENVRAWIWDVAEGADGNPVVVYTRLPREDEHHYRYARWNGFRWVDRHVVAAGGWFPTTPEGKREPEPHYSAGIVLDHDDPTTVYLSRPVDGVFEIERWTTPDGGDTWTSAAITRGSTSNNVRPCVVRGRTATASPTVLWMRTDGGYEHYTRFATSIRMATAEK